MIRRDLSQVITPFVEVNDLKRVTSAGREGSLATRLFRESWALLLEGAASDEAAWWVTGRALAAARLGDIDQAVLSAAGLAPDQIAAVLGNAVDAAGAPLDDDIREAARSALTRDKPVMTRSLPAFVDALAGQPRAGLTRPGRPRIILEPPENHADHCLTVAVYGVLLSRFYDAEAGTVFLAALAHHFHNAGMPDSGFTGEELLGPHLDSLVKYFTGICLRQLPRQLRQATEQARAILPDAGTAEGRAFHAADAIDRVLQILQYGRAASLTPERMLVDMELVHTGPVKSFQDEVLRETGLA